MAVSRTAGVAAAGGGAVQQRTSRQGAVQEGVVQRGVVKQGVVQQGVVKQGVIQQGVVQRATSGRAQVLPVDFYTRPVLEVARDLIGCVVEHRGLTGMIVETEAYHESEPACHAFVGVTPRTRTLFGEPGVAYVYRSYGIHALLNAVCEPAGVGAAVLIRALEPLVGVEEMRMRRGLQRERDLCSGPGKLTQALGVELEENGTSLLDGPVVIRAGEETVASGHGARRTTLPVVSGTRIGITKAVDLRWRFCAAGNPHVSRPHPQ